MDLPGSLAVQYAMGSNNPTSENPALYHLNALFPSKPPVVYTWISYDRSTSMLSCFVSTSSEQPTVPSMQARITLSDYVSLPSNSAYIGFFAGNGGSSSSPQVTLLNWKFQANPSATTSPSSNIVVIVPSVIIVSSVLLIIVVLLVVLRHRQRLRRLRFGFTSPVAASNVPERSLVLPAELNPTIERLPPYSQDMPPPPYTEIAMQAQQQNVGV